MRLKFTLTSKLVVIPVVVIIAFIVIWAIVTDALGKNEKLMHDIVQGYVPAWETSRNLLEALDNVQYSLQNAVASEDPDELNEADTQYASFMRFIAEQIENSVLDQRAESEELQNLVKEYYTLSRENALRMIRGETGEQMIWELENMTKQYNEIKDRLNQNENQNKQQMTSNLHGASRNNQNAESAIKILVICVILGVSLFSYYMITSITKPIKAAIQVVTRISEGDLTVSVAENRAQDEVGILMNSFRDMLETLRNLTVQIKEAANGLASAASEISASVTQIASSATETATAARC